MLQELKKTDVTADGTVTFEEEETGDKQEPDYTGLMDGSYGWIEDTVAFNTGVTQTEIFEVVILPIV